MTPYHDRKRMLSMPEKYWAVLDKEAKEEDEWMTAQILIRRLVKAYIGDTSNYE